MLNCLPVQSFHNSTANFRVHASVTFLVFSDERLLLMVLCLERLKTSLFPWIWLGRCTIIGLSQTFPLTQNMFIDGALILKLCWSCSFADACSLSQTLDKLPLRDFHTRTEHFREQIRKFQHLVQAPCIQKRLQ